MTGADIPILLTSVNYLLSSMVIFILSFLISCLVPRMEMICVILYICCLIKWHHLLYSSFTCVLPRHKYILFIGNWSYSTNYNATSLRSWAIEYNFYGVKSVFIVEFALQWFVVTSHSLPSSQRCAEINARSSEKQQINLFGPTSMDPMRGTVTHSPSEYT